MTAQCPRAELRIDRSFAAAPPPCVDTIMAATSAGDGYLGVAVNLAGEVKARDICLAEVSNWIKSERESRPIGAPGA